MLRNILFLILVTGFVVSAFAQVQPPNTGKMSWDLFQAVAAGQRTRAAGEEVQTVSALLITSVPVNDERLAALRSLGYTVLSAFGNFVLVEAPADQYAKPEGGIDSIVFVSNATLPVRTIQNGGDIMVQQASFVPVTHVQTTVRSAFTSGLDPAE